MAARPCAPQYRRFFPKIARPGNPRGSGRRGNSRGPGRQCGDGLADFRIWLSRLSQSCQVRLKPPVWSPRMPVASSSVPPNRRARRSAASQAGGRAGCRHRPTSGPADRSRRPLRSPAGWPKDAAARHLAASRLVLVRFGRRPYYAGAKAAMLSPAMPPKTVELATPLPPRRLAPCTPPASSPATNRPGRAQWCVGLEDHAAHHVMRGRHHLDPAASQVEAAVGAALDHALEAAAHLSGPRCFISM